MTCARCKGRGDEADEGQHFRACMMCGGDGAAVACWYVIRRDVGWVHCCRPSVAWDDESPRCHRHDPETIKKIREQVARVARARKRLAV